MTDGSRFAKGEFRVGHVFNQSLSVLSQNIVKLCVVTGAAVLPLLLAPLALPANLGGPLGGPVAVGPSGINLSQINPYGLFGSLAVLSVVMLLVFNVSEVMVLYIAVQHMRRKPVDLVEGLKVALGRFFPLIGVVLLIFLAIFGVGLLVGVVTGVLAAVVPGLAVLAPVLGFLSIVPYFMLIIMWSVARPACVVERLGPLRSLGRSRELTRGHRWKILGLVLLTLLCLLLALIAVGVIAGVAAALGSAVSFNPWMVRVVSAAFYAVVLAFFWIMIAVTYRDLRVVNEGIDTDQVATVFE
jgi:hypothetical protein